MNEIPLLNDVGRDARVSRGIVSALTDMVVSLERRMVEIEMSDFTEYREARARLLTARECLDRAEKVFARNFKV